MFILNNNLIPSLYHQLVLTASSKKYLTWLDRSVRAAFRSWLKLPHNTPKAYFHAKIFAGGLGIVTLEHQVPLMKIKRIDRLWASNDPVIREMLSTARHGTAKGAGKRCLVATGGGDHERGRSSDCPRD